MLACPTLDISDTRINPVDLTRSTNYLVRMDHGHQTQDYTVFGPAGLTAAEIRLAIKERYENATNKVVKLVSL